MGLEPEFKICVLITLSINAVTSLIGITTSQELVAYGNVECIRTQLTDSDLAKYSVSFPH